MAIINPTEITPEATFATIQPFVEQMAEATGHTAVLDTNPMRDPLDFVQEVRKLGPRYATPEERAAAAAKDETGNLKRQELAERRASWGAGQEAVITDVSTALGLRETEYTFGAPKGTEVSLGIAVEGANEQDAIRTGALIEAHKSGLYTVKKVVLAASAAKNIQPDKNGYEVAQDVIDGIHAQDPDMVRGANGKPVVRVYKQTSSKPNARTAVDEILTHTATAADRAGTLALSTSALYAPWMMEDAIAMGIPHGITPEQWIVAGAPAPERALAARAKAPNAVYGAEIIKAAEAAGYHRAAILNTRSN
jgi:hypothetical protein